MLSIRVVLRIAIGFAVLQAATTVQAGPVERMTDVAVHPTNPDVMVVHYEFGGTGLLYTRDRGRSFRLLCANAIDKQRPSGPIALTHDGHLLIGTFDGIWQDDGLGCGWSIVEAAERRWYADFTHDPTNPEITFAVSSNGGGAENGIMRRDEAGKWTQLGKRESALITRVRATKTPAGMRIYETAARLGPMMADGGLGETEYVVRVSDDNGETWREHPLKLGTGSYRLEAIDPQNPDRLLISLTVAGAAGTVFLSSDQGANFAPYLPVSGLGGLTMAPDGRIWIGEPPSVSAPGASKGLWFAKSLGEAPQKIAEFGVECLAYEATTNTLFACQPYSFGKIDLGNVMFEELVRFATAKEFVSCPGMEMKSVCEEQLCAEYCGPGHFASSPLCCAYTTSSCGRAVAEMEGTAKAGACEGSTAGASDAAGASGAAARAGSAAQDAGRGSHPAAAGSAGQARAGAGGTGDSREDGCGCHLARSDRSSGALAGAAFIVVVGCVAARRRVRIRRAMAAGSAKT